MLFAVCLLLLVAFPAQSMAQPVATLEVFDDPALSQRWGTMDGTMKVLYVRFANFQVGPQNSYTGLEFSLTGLHDFDVVAPTFTSDPNVLLGTVVAPADPQNGTGGINVAWPDCQTNELLMTLALVPGSPPVDRVIRVAPRFPPSNPTFPIPHFRACDDPCFCLYAIGGQPYILNPEVSTANTAWATVKALYR